MKRMLGFLILISILWWKWGEKIQQFISVFSWTDLLWITVAILIFWVLGAGYLRHRHNTQAEKWLERNPPPPAKSHMTPQVVMLPPGYGPMNGGQLPSSTPVPLKQATWTDLPPERYETL